MNKQQILERLAECRQAYEEKLTPQQIEMLLENTMSALQDLLQLDEQKGRVDEIEATLNANLKQLAKIFSPEGPLQSEEWIIAGRRGSKEVQVWHQLGQQIVHLRKNQWFIRVQPPNEEFTYEDQEAREEAAAAAVEEWTNIAIDAEEMMGE
jgi:hypothetical protein